MIIVCSSLLSSSLTIEPGCCFATGAGAGAGVCTGAGAGATATGGAGDAGSGGGGRETLVSVTLALTSMRCPQRRHFMRTVLPATLSSPIWYFALQFSQRNFNGAASRQA